MDEITGEDVEQLIFALRRIGNAISENLVPGQDATGGTVGCMTSAVMGVTAGLCSIASAISDLAEAIREGHDAQ